MNLQIATQLIMMLIFNNHDENCYPVNKFEKFATISVVILKKSSISEMQHRKTYNYFNFHQNWVSRSVKTVHTNVFAKIISFIRYIDLQIYQ